MVAITATQYDTPSPQASLGRVRLEQARLDQARRDADQAEARARRMRNLADQADRDAQASQARLGALRMQTPPADASTYSRPQAAPAASAAAGTELPKQQFWAQVATVAGNGFGFPRNPLQAYAATSKLPL